MLCGLKLSDPGISTEPRGLTATQSRLADIFTAAAVPGRSAALEVCVASPNAAAARVDAAQASLDRKLSDYRNEIPDLRNQAFAVDPLPGRRGDRTLPSLEHCSMQQTSHPAGIARCRRNRFSADGNMIFKLLFAGSHDMGSFADPFGTGRVAPVSLPVNRQRLCSHQSSNCPSALTGQFASTFPMFPGDRELDALFEDHGVS